MKPLSLRWRISLTAAVVILFSVVLVSLWAYAEMKEFFNRTLDRQLGPIAEKVAALVLENRTEGDINAQLNAIVGVSDTKRTPCVRIWVDEASDPLAALPSEGIASEILNPIALADVSKPEIADSVFFDISPRPNEYRAVWARRKAVDGRVVNIVIGMSSHNAHSELIEYRGEMFLVGGGIVVVMIVLTMILTNMGLRPIAVTARELSGIEGRNIRDARIRNLKSPKELQPFVVAVANMLERLAEALDDQKRFVANASHELRTPLALAHSTIDATLIKERTAEEYRQSMVELREDLERMSALAESLLLLARLDASGGMRDAEVFDLAWLIKDVAQRFETRAAAANRTLRVNVRSVDIRGNPRQIESLLSNLIDNAIQYAPPGRAIELATHDQSDGNVFVTVHDDGGNISKEALPQLFNPFYRADASRSRTSGGAGLGLSIAREIALRHGGDISVESAPGRGTTFRVRLPKA